MTDEAQAPVEVPENLRYYAMGFMPKEAGREFTRAGGFRGTDINAMWRIKALTAMFGPAGIGWYTEIVKRWTETYETGETKVYCDLNLFVKDPATGEWSKPITGTGGNDVILARRGQSPFANDEQYKMAETDAFGSACKKLGIGHNVYFDKDSTSKYLLGNEGVDGYAAPPKPKAKQNKDDSFWSKTDKAKEEPKAVTEDHAPAEIPETTGFVTADTVVKDVKPTSSIPRVESDIMSLSEKELAEAIDAWSVENPYKMTVTGYKMSKEVMSTYELTLDEKRELYMILDEMGAGR